MFSTTEKNRTDCVPDFFFFLGGTGNIFYIEIPMKMVIRYIYFFFNLDLTVKRGLVCGCCCVSLCSEETYCGCVNESVGVLLSMPATCFAVALQCISLKIQVIEL